MDERKYNVVFKGEIHEQATLSLVQERLASIFKLDMGSIKLIFSKQRTIVKKNVSYELCQKVEQGFLNAGAYVDIEEILPEVIEPETIESRPESDYVEESEYNSEPESEYAPEPEPEAEYADEYAPEPEPETEYDNEYAPEPEAEYYSETEYPPEQEAEYDSETEYQSESETEYMPETEDMQEPDSEYTEEPEAEPEFEPEIENFQPEQENEEDDPDSDFEYESDNEEQIESEDMPLGLEMENEPKEVVIEPAEETDEPSFGYAPLSEYDPIADLQSLRMENNAKKVEPESEKEIDEPSFGYAPLPEYDTDVDFDSDLEPEFEILEDELESDFEMIEAEPEPDSDYDEEYEFDKIESVEIEDDDVETDEFIASESVENPYAAPHANLEQEDPGSNKTFVQPQKLSPKSGVNWLRGGFTLFRVNPFSWIASTFIFFLISGIASFIPFLGAIASNLFNPVFMAGFILGAKEQDEGGSFRISHVFAGFSNNFGQLILFGLLYSIVTLAVFGLIGVIFVLIFVTGGIGAMNFSDPSSIAALANISPILIIIISLVVMLISIPIIMVYYFGSALISVNQAPILEAVKMSFRACLSNMLPLLVYGLACFGIFVAAFAIIGGIAALLGMMLKVAGIVVGVIGMIIVTFTIMPIFIASTYAAYKDIFYTK